MTGGWYTAAQTAHMGHTRGLVSSLGSVGLDVCGVSTVTTLGRSRWATNLIGASGLSSSSPPNGTLIAPSPHGRYHEGVVIGYLVKPYPPPPSTTKLLSNGSINGHLISLIPREEIHRRTMCAGPVRKDPHPSLSPTVPTIICQALTGAAHRWNGAPMDLCFAHTWKTRLPSFYLPAKEVGSAKPGFR